MHADVQHRRAPRYSARADDVRHRGEACSIVLFGHARLMARTDPRRRGRTPIQSQGEIIMSTIALEQKPDVSPQLRARIAGVCYVVTFVGGIYALVNTDARVAA